VDVVLYESGRNGIGELTEIDCIDGVVESIRIVRCEESRTDEGREGTGLPAREMEKEVPLDIELGGVEAG
jgi:hypothetical protein